MNTSARNWPRAILVLVLGIVVPMELPAGEAIQFSNARNRQDPTAKSKLPGDKDGEGLGRVNPLDFVPSVSDGARRDPVRDRKARNAAAERANWMVLNRGDLDKKDEQKRAFGIRDASFEKESDPNDYFFSAVREKDGKSKAPFARPSDRDRAEPESGPEESPGLGGKIEDNSETRRNQVLGKNGQPLGDHTAKDLDLKDMLNTSKANSLAPTADRTALLWKEVLGGSGDSSAIQRRDEASTADSFRGSVSAGSSRGADSFGFRSDSGARASASVPSGLSESSSRSFGLSSLPVAPRASDSGFGLSPGISAAPPANGRYAAAPGGLGADPASSYRSQPQRSPSTTFQSIPSRPGYGGR